MEVPHCVNGNSIELLGTNTIKTILIEKRETRRSHFDSMHGDTDIANDLLYVEVVKYILTLHEWE